MRIFWNVCVLLNVFFFFIGSGCKKDENTEKQKSHKNKKGGKTSTRSTAAVTCKENTKISLQWSEKEKMDLKDFALKKTTAFLSGMRYNAKSTAKLLYVAMANYEAKMKSLFIALPQKEGEALLLFIFKTQNKDVESAKSLAAYKKMKVPTGTFKPGRFEVHYYKAPKKLPVILSNGFRGKGKLKLTRSGAHHVCGTVDFSTPHGSVIKASFNVPVAKDIWDR